MSRAVPLLLLWLLLARSAGADGTGLPAGVREAMERHGIAAEAVSIYLQALDAAEPLLAVRADVARNPASVIKLVTTAAALETLGPAYTWATEVLAAGPVEGERLRGDLVVRGYGDPYLTTESLWSLVSSLRERGLRRIDGDLVLDSSHFQVPPGDRGAFDGRPDRVYNALPDALSLNFQAVRFHLVPEPGAGSVRVYAEPALAELRVRNELRLAPGACPPEEPEPAVRAEPTDGGALVRLSGSYVAACGESTLNRLVMPAADLFGGAFATAWRRLGGELQGSHRSGKAPREATLLYRHESRSLAEVVRGINKYSNNLMARLLLLTLGAEAYGAPGTVEKGQAAVAQWLRSRGLELPELVLDNGSGLSRTTRISGRGLGRLLRLVFEGPYMPELMSSLAVLGVDGTGRRRLKDSPLGGRAHIKTGSLAGVSALSGYVLDRAGRRWVVVVLINQPGIENWQAKAVQDALLLWVHDGAAQAAAPGRSPRPELSGAAAGAGQAR